MKKTRLLRAALALLAAALLLAALLPAGLAKGAQKIGLMLEGTSVTFEKWTSPSLTWTSSDETVAVASAGEIRALKAGRTVISATDGNRTARCGVVVLPASVSLKPGEKLSLPRAGSERYQMKNGAVASVTKKGVVTGKKAGSTVLRVRCGRQKVEIKVTVADGSGKPDGGSKAAALDCAATAEQIVLVEYTGGSRATLSIHEKKDGVWTQLSSCKAYVGKNGIDKSVAGDKRTPTGTYNLTTPFGIKADPSAKMAYTRVTKYHYWCGASNSGYYNQLVDERVVDRKHTSSDEYLINYKGVYNYCMFIDYNAEGKAGKGSCIFLHCTGKNKYTAGCVAVSESMMRKIIQWARPGVKIVIKRA